MPAPREGGAPTGRSLPEGGGDETVAVWVRVGAVWVLDRCFPRHQAERLVERARAEQPGRVFGIFARFVDPNSPAPLEAPVITTSWYHTDSPEAIESLCEACAARRGERDRCGPSGTPCEACGARPDPAARRLETARAPTPAEVVAACGARHAASCDAFARAEGWASWAALAASLAFELLDTGGGCEAWAAAYAGVHGARRVLLTDHGGAGRPGSADWLVGVQDADEQAVAVWGSDGSRAGAA